MASNNYKPEDWLTEISNGLEYRRKFGLEDMWGQFEAIYYNVHNSMLNDGPNIFLSQGDAMLSTLTVPTARVKVSATKPEEVELAPLVETLDNTILRELDLKSEIEDATLHAFLFGRGFIKFGYDSEWGYDPSLDMGGSLQLGATLTQLNRKGDKRIEYDSTVSPGTPWARVVLPHDIVVPWGAKNISNTPWIAHRVVRKLSDLREDPKYIIPKSMQAQISIQDFVESYRTLQRNRTHRRMSSSIDSREPEFVEFYEIHDRCTGMIYCVTWDCDKFLRKETNALQIDNILPFAGLGFTPRTRSFWTTPDAQYLYFIQAELSDIAVQRTKQRRISTLKFLVDGSVLSDEELAKVLSPDVGIAAKVNAGQKLTDALAPVSYSPNQQLIVEEEQLRSAGREQIGFSKNQVGEYTPGRKTATEVGEVGQASRLRMSRRGAQIQKLYEDSVRILNNIMFTYWSIPRYLPVLGQQRTNQWQAVNGASLRGRYAYSIEFVEENELAQRKFTALQLYGTLVQDPGIDPIGLRAYLISQFNDPAFERIFSADVRGRMLELQQQNGGVQPQVPQRGGGGLQLPTLQIRDAQNSNSTADPSRLLAGGGFNA